MSDLQKIFLEEAEELLLQAEPLVLALEKECSPASLEELFRITHTMKGSAGIAGIKGIRALTHRLEDLLEKLRSNELKAGTGVIDLLLKAFDCSKFLIEELGRGNDRMPPASLLEEISFIAGEKDRKPGDDREIGSPAPEQGKSFAGEGETGDIFKELSPEALGQLLEGLREGKKAYRLRLDFGQNFFRQGHNLDYLLDDLAEIGDLVAIVADDKKVPLFTRLDPEDFYLLFTLYFLSEAAPGEVQSIFQFVLSEENRFVLHRLDENELKSALEKNISSCGCRKILAPQGSGSSLQRHLPFIVKVLRQQERALKLADEAVLPGLLPAVRRIVERLAERLGVAAERSRALAINEEKEFLLKTISRLLSASGLYPNGAPEGAVGEQATLKTVSEAGSPQNIAAAKGLSADEKSQGRAKKNSSFRLPQETASALMSLAGQLVIAKNSLPYLVKELEEMGLNDKAQVLRERFLSFDSIARELQDKVMDIWLLPVQDVFSRFPRFVRDMTKKLNKKVEVLISGGETRLDRDIVEELYEPLLHLVRNALDHGIEEIEERQMAGKSPAGVIRLSAYRQGERVLVSVSDDGRGIDVKKLVEKALARGFVSAEQLADMEEMEKLKLVFCPGLSTKEGSSELSGRGVGMDVVEKKVKSLGGTVQLHSAPGKGTTTVLNLPFTMATSEVLVVQVGKGIYGLPLSSVRETVRMQKEKINTMRGRPVVLWRGQIIPVLQSHRFLEQGDCTFAQDQVLVVLQQNVALAVEAILSRETVIVKPLKGDLKKMTYLMGAAVLGDGRLLLVLNPAVMVTLFLEDKEETGYGA